MQCEFGRDSQQSSSQVAFQQATIADARWKEESFRVAAHVTANSPIMNQYAGSSHACEQRQKLVCVALYASFIPW